MKLPPHLLEQVKWFENYREAGDDTFGDRFVLHFKQWWKPRQTLWIDGSFTRSDGPSKLYRRSDEATELLAQLKEHCNQ